MGQRPRMASCQAQPKSAPVCAVEKCTTLGRVGGRAGGWEGVTEARWRGGLKPFDGGILLSPYQRVEDLRTELSGVVGTLPPAAE